MDRREMDPEKAEKVSTFQSFAGCDADFATSFLEASAWNIDLALSNLFGGGGGDVPMPPASGSRVGADGTGGAGGMTNPAAADLSQIWGGDFQEDEPRTALPQFRDTLISVDPAERMPQRQTSVASNHPLEAFRDFRKEGAGGASRSAAAQEPEVFGLSKRPKNLAEIYKAPTELCFLGSFEELRAAGRAHQRWLLVNIQSPTEFASQQLNADTWHDETLQAVIKASFLFWQQYYDSPDGQKFCRFYLPSTIPGTGLPLIGIIDPITGQLVKTWTGFKDAERLMDKLMDLADSPPIDPEAMIAEALAREHAGAAAPSPLRSAAAVGSYRSLGGDLDGVSAGDEELAAAIAASLEGSHVPGGMAGASRPPAAPPQPTDAEIDAIWGEAADERADGMQMRVRLANGATITRRFGPSQTLREVLVAIHVSGHRLDPSKTYGLTTFGTAPVTGDDCTLAGLGVTHGAYSLTEC